MSFLLWGAIKNLMSVYLYLFNARYKPNIGVGAHVLGLCFNLPEKYS